MTELCQAMKACPPTNPGEGRYKLPSNDGRTYRFCKDCLKALKDAAKARGHGGFAVMTAIARARLMAGEPEE